MKCPIKDKECNRDCAWLIEQYVNNNRHCAIAIIASSETDLMGFYPANSFEERTDNDK